MAHILVGMSVYVSLVCVLVEDNVSVHLDASFLNFLVCIKMRLLQNIIMHNYNDYKNITFEGT